MLESLGFSLIFFHVYISTDTMMSTNIRQVFWGSIIRNMLQGLEHKHVYTTVACRFSHVYVMIPEDK